MLKNRHVKKQFLQLIVRVCMSCIAKNALQASIAAIQVVLISRERKQIKKLSLGPTQIWCNLVQALGSRCMCEHSCQGQGSCLYFCHACMRVAVAHSTHREGRGLVGTNSCGAMRSAVEARAWGSSDARPGLRRTAVLSDPRRWNAQWCHAVRA